MKCVIGCILFEFRNHLLWNGTDAENDVGKYNSRIINRHQQRYESGNGWRIK